MCSRTIVAIFFVLSCTQLFGREPGHYVPGVANIRDLTTPATPGFYYVQYNAYYTTNDYKDRNGDSVNSIGPITNIDADIDVFAVTPVFMWSTEKEILGAKNSWYISPSIARSNVAASLSSLNLSGTFDSDALGLGDLYVQPLMLGWKNPTYDLNLGLGAYVPIGKYDKDSDDNVGLGFWTAQIQGSLYYYLNNQSTAILLARTYEYHGKKEGTDITPGDHFTLEYGISQYLSERLEVGVQGYIQRQVDDDGGHLSLFDLSVKTKIRGIGAQLSYWIAPRLNLSLKYMKEYDAEARFEGNWLMLNITYVPSPLL